MKGGMKKGIVSPQTMAGHKSLAELKAMSARNNDIYNQMNRVIDYRKQEMEAAMQQLYTAVEDFRLNQHSELRREIEVAYDMAIRSVQLEYEMAPWWKKLFGQLNPFGVARVEARAEVFLVTIKERVLLAHAQAQAEAEQRSAEEKARQEKEAAEAKAAAEAAKKKAEGEVVDAAGAEAIANSPAVRPGSIPIPDRSEVKPFNPEEYGQAMAKTGKKNDSAEANLGTDDHKNNREELQSDMELTATEEDTPVDLTFEE